MIRASDAFCGKTTSTLKVSLLVDKRSPIVQVAKGTRPFLSGGGGAVLQ